MTFLHSHRFFVLVSAARRECGVVAHFSFSLRSSVLVVMVRGSPFSFSVSLGSDIMFTASISIRCEKHSFAIFFFLHDFLSR